MEAPGIAVAAEPVTVHPGDKLNVAVNVTNPDDFSVDYRITHLLLEHQTWIGDWVLLGDCEAYDLPWKTVPAGAEAALTGIGSPGVDYHTFTIPSDVGDISPEDCKVTVDVEGRKTDNHSVTGSWPGIFSETKLFEVKVGLGKPPVDVDVTT